MNFTGAAKAPAAGLMGRIRKTDPFGLGREPHRLLVPSGPRMAPLSIGSVAAVMNNGPSGVFWSLGEHPRASAPSRVRHVPAIARVGMGRPLEVSLQHEGGTRRALAQHDNNTKAGELLLPSGCERGVQ